MQEKGLKLSFLHCPMYHSMKHLSNFSLFKSNTFFSTLNHGCILFSNVAIFHTLVNILSSSTVSTNPLVFYQNLPSATILNTCEYFSYRLKEAGQNLEKQ